ncbi:MAG: hypothetical protein QOF21_1890 [Actinomycetota bacterium]|jgi:hypothetical protein
MSTLRAIVLVVAGVLLLSMGGAIDAAPITIPLLWIATRSSPSRAYRVATAIVGGLTAAEVAWAALYTMAGESTPAIWLGPALAALATAVAFTKVEPRRHLVRVSD